MNIIKIIKFKNLKKKIHEDEQFFHFIFHSYMHLLELHTFIFLTYYRLY